MQELSDEEIKVLLNNSENSIVDYPNYSKGFLYGIITATVVAVIGSPILFFLSIWGYLGTIVFISLAVFFIVAFRPIRDYKDGS